MCHQLRSAYGGLEIGKSRFFALLREYRRNPDEFSLNYQRATPTIRLRRTVSVEKEIESELILEKGLIEDPSLPITTNNYSAMRDRLARHGVMVSSPTVIDRAIRLRRKAVTSLIQSS